jgi:hypothetical protein
MAYEFEGELELEDELEGEFEDEMEGELEEEMEDEAGLEGEGWLGTLGNIAGSLLGESEDEYEGEAEDEYEDEYEDESEEELSPIRKIYPDAMMEHLGELAAEAESEEEAAEHFLPLVGMAASKLLPVVAKAVAPMAKKAIPKIARAVTKATPHLTKGIGKVAKALHRNPKTRHLLRAVPGIARRTVGHIAHRAARGGHVTPRAAVRTLAKQTRRVLGTPAHRAQALRRHHKLERGFHRRVGRGIARPHVRHGRRWRYGQYPQGYRGRGISTGVVRGTGAGGVAPRGVAAGTQHPGSGAVVPGIGRTGVGRTGVRHGQLVAGQCTCPACPTCGAAAHATAPTAAAASTATAPAYCRCCGQVIR